MTLPLLEVHDDFLPPLEHVGWKIACEQAEQNPPITGGTLVSYETVARRPLLDEILARTGFTLSDIQSVNAFNIWPRLTAFDADTTWHQDQGSYMALYYPTDCDTSLLELKGGYEGLPPHVGVKANRLVYLDAARVHHKQRIPIRGVRRSIVFAFRNSEAA